MITENGEYNYIRIIGIVLFIGILIYALIPSTLIFPEKPKPITEKTVYVNVTDTIYIRVTPTPDEGFYYADEYTNGSRKLNRPFSILRKDVSGFKDMKVSIRVYNYRMMDSYLWFNVHDYKYYKQFPSSIDKKFIFIWINIEMDDISADDTRLFLPNRNLFAVQVNGDIYPPIDYPLDLRIKELEYTNDYNDVVKTKAYGQNIIIVSQGSSAGLQYSEKVDYLKGGRSNSEDGYIIYEIPRDAEPKDILVLGQFYSFGSSQWRLI